MGNLDSKTQASTERGAFDELVRRTFLILNGNRSTDSIYGNGNLKRNFVIRLHLYLLVYFMTMPITSTKYGAEKKRLPTRAKMTPYPNKTRLPTCKNLLYRSRKILKYTAYSHQMATFRHTKTVAR